MIDSRRGPPPALVPAVATVILAAVGAQSAGLVVTAERGDLQRSLRARRQVRVGRAGFGGVVNERREALRTETAAVAHGRSPVAQRVGLVEEDHHPAVTQ